MNSGKSQRTHLRIRTLVRNARAVALHHMGRGLVEAVLSLRPPCLTCMGEGGHFIGCPLRANERPRAKRQ